jgi:hypothetical protein
LVETLAEGQPIEGEQIEIAAGDQQAVVVEIAYTDGMTTRGAFVRQMGASPQIV